MNRCIKLVILQAILAGCTTGPVASVPIAVSCVKEAPAKPQTTPEGEILAMSDWAATLTTWTERLILKAAVEKYDAIVQACR